MKPLKKDLRFSDSGNEVKKLHALLLLLGYEIAHEEKQDNLYGRSTAEAVEMFQRDNDLERTGEVDTRTYELLGEKTRSIREALEKQMKDAGSNGGGSNGGSAEVKQTPLAEYNDINPELRALLLNNIRDSVSGYVRETFGGDKERLKEALSDLPESFVDFTDDSLADIVRKHVIPRLSKEKVFEETLSSLSDKISTTPGDKIKDLLHLDTSPAQNPIFDTAFRKDKIRSFGRMAKLADENIDRLLEERIDFDNISAHELDVLEKKGLVKENEKDELFNVLELSKLTGENVELVRALRDAGVEKIGDLLEYNKENWVSFLKENKIPVTEKGGVEEYADNIVRNLEQAHPDAVFMHRVINRGEPKEVKQNKWISWVSERPREAWTASGGLHPETPRADGLNDDEIAVAKEITGFVNTYKYLGVGDVLRDDAISPDAKKDIITEKIAVLQDFYKANPGIDLANTDLVGNPGMLNWEGIPEKEQPFIRKQLMAYQRTNRYADGPDTAVMLLKNGFDSAAAISEHSLDDFIKLSGLPRDEGRTIYARAGEQASLSMHSFEVMRDYVKGNFKDLAVSNVSVGVLNDLRRIEGFNEIFGNQDYCDCEHCKSIFSPAAYFTDMMYFVEQHVSKKLFIPNKTNHPLYLKNRRPDLWTLQLTCENTNTEIPYLQIVNEVLENYLKTQLAIGNVYQSLFGQQNSFFMPFNLPLQETRVFLSHFDFSLYDVYRLLKETPRNVWREKLLLTKEEFDIILTDGQNTIQARFGNQPLADMPVRDFLDFTGLKRAELDELLASTFIPDIAGVTVERIAIPGDIQQYREVMKGLNKKRLDMIHRFMRLWRRTQWKIEELDLLLNSMKAAGLINTLDELDNANQNFPKFLQLGMLKLLQENFGFSVEELCGIAGNLTSKVLKGKTETFLERLFDMEALFGVNNVQPDGRKIYNNNFTLKANKAQDTKTGLILAGLGLTEQELLLLLEKLGRDTTQDIVIDNALLSRLYCHARLAAAMKLQFEEFMILVKLFLGKDNITGPSDYYPLLDAQKWVKSTPLTISELNFIIAGVASSEKQFTYDLDTISGLIQELQKQQPADKVAALKQVLKKEFNITDEQVPALLQMVASDINGGAVALGLNTTFTNGQPDTPNDLNGLIQLFRQAERTMLLVNKFEFDKSAHDLVASQPAYFGIADIKALTVGDIRSLHFYYKMLQPDPEKQDIINASLSAYQLPGGFDATGISALSVVWKQPEALIQSVSDNLPKSAAGITFARHLKEVLDFCAKLGINGESFKKFGALDYAGLQTVSNICYGCFAAHYVDEKTRLEKIEPYYDKINTLKRDALCNYIIARRDKFKFRNRNELYAFFLLDVEMSGCFRTSRVVQATGSVQLYIHRCLLNLEQSDPALNPAIVDVKVNPTWIPADEWEWRKNYRVWEANRKVFLYPENYIDPLLRLNKTHLCKNTEEEILQEKITKESAEAAYKTYLAGFTELANLRYAGGYTHHMPVEIDVVDFSNERGMNNARKESTYMLKTSQQIKDVFYFFARTSTHPYQYYYRTLDLGKQRWGNWQKIELGIEAGEISSLIHNGKLYIFWTEVQRKEISNVNDGNATSGGYIFKVYTKYSSLQEHNKWTPPQRVYIGHTHAQENFVFARVWGNNALSQTERDKKKDYTLDQYEEKVFRKPYAIINSGNGSLANPLKLYSIWSQYKGVSEVDYWVNATMIPVNIAMGIILMVNFPSVSFKVVNNNFPQVKTAKMTGTLIVGSTSIVSPLSDVEFTLSNANSCTGRVKLFGISLALGLPIHTAAVPQNIYASSNLLSLSRNLISDAIPNDMQTTVSNINNAGVSFLKNEYNVAFSENGYYVHYMETGDKQFADSANMVCQYPDGDAWMQLPDYTSLKLSTILTDELGDILFAKGLEQFLALSTQQMVDDNGSMMDLKGPYGEYYWEMFFHIPFMIANHLNANNKFKEAKWWYERIFNPTAEETPADAKPYDHNWRYREFRNLDIQKLKDILSDTATIEVYHKDPFDPHAIARLRVSAYQKAIVMKYIDNLVDWGDYLFMQDTRESIGEAMQLYVLASDILGPRPEKLGKCSTAKPEDLTYQKIGPRIDADSEFLITLENWNWVIEQESKWNKYVVQTSKSLYSTMDKVLGKYGGKDISSIAKAAKYTNAAELVTEEAVMDHVGAGGGVMAKASTKYNSKIKAYKDVSSRNKGVSAKRPKANGEWKYKEPPQRQKPNKTLVKQSIQVFCVPNNADLLKYWDRIGERMYNIRNCMNISGVRRSLSLFQPPIDPMLLVRARAAGISLDEILGQLMAPAGLPPYRFSFLLDKAKQLTQLVQSFGAGLLSALEKKDTEELNLLRSVHERNILKLTREVKKKQFEESQKQYKALAEGTINVQNRIDYYQGLVDTGLNGWEITQQVSSHTASGLEIVCSIQKLLGGILFLVPQLGSPFAMKYGGSELGNSAQAFGEMTRSLAAIAHSISASAGLEATFQRREEEWKNQLKLARQEYKQTLLQELAGEIRQAIAEKELDMHDKNMEQAEEIHDFYKNKTSGLGLYQFLSSRLNRVYREAYNLAYELAKLAEKTYQFERNDDAVFIAGDNWQYDRAGLMAGESLMLQLQRLEQAYLTKNVRTPEITQSFSLAMLDPQKLLELKQKGSCQFKIPELAFETLYPGQYNRIIRAARLTMACVTGPFTNVSAKLTLIKGEVEKTDKAALIELAQGKNSSVTMSTSNNDTGMFDFNFKDERYFPFEGAGAVNSEWRVELPMLRSFDYHSIADVILTLSYTALDGNRADAEAAIAADIVSYATNPGLFRLISLRNEFPDAWHKLIYTVPGQANKTQIKTEAFHFPYVLQNSDLRVTGVKLYLKPVKNGVVSTSAMKINTKDVTWAGAEDITFSGAANNQNTIKGGTVANIPGSAMKSWDIETVNNEQLDKDNLEDVLLLVKYKIQ